jgi:hypothetical protein
MNKQYLRRKRIMVTGNNKSREIDLGDDGRRRSGRAGGEKGGVTLHGLPVAANDSASKATPEIGDIESAGEHKGEIYGGIFPDGKPGWILEEPKPMTHYDAVKLKGRALPTREQGKYIDTIKDKGGLKDIFARHSDSSSSAGFFWLAEHDYVFARSQQFSGGTPYDYYVRNYELPVLAVRR